MDIKYYEEKKQKLLQKSQALQMEYLNNAFKFTNEVKEIDAELKMIDEWIKKNTKEKK